VACGARDFLIAYNVNLDSTDVAAARAVARAVREANGGLPGVRALGLWLETRGIAQVSMNVTDLAAAPLHEVFAAVKREAERLGVAVLESELVGLLPRAAWEASAGYDLRWREDPARAILEDRLGALLESE
jgi:glutamate formiminotransferase